MDHNLLREVIDKLGTLSTACHEELRKPDTKGILDQLGRSRGTDKASGGHDYLHFYERFLWPMRDQPIALLEVGVGGGNSLRMWKDFFPIGRIFGMDIHGNCKDYEEERITIEIGDQGNDGNLENMHQSHGPFDVIVDDAGHDPRCQLSCFRYMFRYIRSGGFYILEDIGDRSVSEFFGKIAVDLIHGEDSTGQSSMCEFVSTYREAIVARRKT